MILQQSVSLEKFCYFHFWPLWLSTRVETQSKQLKKLVTAWRSPTAEEVSIHEHWQVHCGREGAYSPVHVPQTQSVGRTFHFPNMSRLNHFSPSLLQSCNLPIQHIYTKGPLCSRHCLVAGRARLTLLALSSLWTTLLTDWPRFPHLLSPSTLHTGAYKFFLNINTSLLEPLQWLPTASSLKHQGLLSPASGLRASLCCWALLAC